MGISRDRVDEIARLALLELSDDEAHALESQLSQVLDYVAQLETLDLDGVPAMSAMTLATTFRDDDAAPRVLDRDVVLGLAPAHDETQVLVPRVVDHG